MHRAMTQKQTHNSLATATSAEAAWSRLTTGSMQLTAEAVRGRMSCNFGLQQVCMRLASALPIVSNVRIRLFITLFMKLTTVMYPTSLLPISMMPSPPLPNLRWLIDSQHARTYVPGNWGIDLAYDVAWINQQEGRARTAGL